MKFFIDLQKKQLIKSAASNVALDHIVLKRRDNLALEIVFVSRNAVATMPAGTITSVAIKKAFADPNFLALSSGTPPTLNLHTVPLEAAFFASPASIAALLEISWTVPGETTRTATLSAEIQNSVILGTEGTPAAIPDLKATQAQAEAGLDNESWMTPLRTAQAIEALASTASQTTDASLLTSGTLADARLSANVVLTGDSRLSNARTPTAHAASHATGGSDPITPASIGGQIATVISLTPPSAPTPGMRWIHEDLGRAFEYFDGAWVELGGGGSEILARRFATSSTNPLIYYTAKAPSGTSDAASGWAVKRTNLNNSGTIASTATASGIWNNREILTYD